MWETETPRQPRRRRSFPSSLTEQSTPLFGFTTATPQNIRRAVICKRAMLTTGPSSRRQVLPTRVAAPKKQARDAKAAIPLSEPWLLFATEAVGQLCSIGHELSKASGIKAFCSALAGELTNAHRFLEGMENVEVQPATTRRVQKLLENLERLCRWPASAGLAPSDNALHPARFPALGKALTDKPAVVKAIKSFATDKRAAAKRTQLLKIVRAFSTPAKSTEDPDLPSLLSSSKPPEHQDHQKYIRPLHSSLAKHCLCPDVNGHRVITTNLRLRTGGADDVDNNAGVDFKVFFLDHPHQHGGEDFCEWQEAQINVSGKRVVRFVEDRLAVDQPVSQRGQVISVGTFCQLISNRQRARLNLAVSDTGLVWVGSAPLSRTFHLQAPTVSLAKLLSSAKLSRKKRLLLSYFLAKAVWQFYDSDWMCSSWTKDKIHFMFERRSDVPKGICIDEPFLAASFDSTGISSNNTSHDGFRTHPFPKLLALGIMLLEIELGISIEDHRLPESLGPDGETTVNTDPMTAREIFSRTAWEDKETFGVIKDVIKICLNPDPDDFKGDIGELRQALEKHVIKPLQVFYQSAWDAPDTSTIKPTVLENPALQTLAPDVVARTTSCSPPQPEPTILASYPDFAQPSSQWPVYPLPAHPSWLFPTLHVSDQSLSPSLRSPAPTSLPAGSMASSNAGFTSELWFNRLDNFNSVLRPKPRDKDDQYRQVRIAILDTGVTEDFVEQVKDYKDFVTGDDDVWVDNTGHGTNAVRLVQKVFNLAAIYVARVFEHSKAATNTATLIAKAIRHAIDVWHIDVIVLASGFETTQPEMLQAIEHANKDHVLIFAAAANHGNNANIAFPGCLYISHKVMCMFSTDANTRCSPNFNPSASTLARYSFAVLGENIKLLDTEQSLSGTSFATMIGAGLAARILDFSRHADTRRLIRGTAALSTVEGMSAVFATMVRGGLDNGYHCMAPWKMIPGDYVEGNSVAQRAWQRGYVCETISRALENMYKN